MSVVSAANAQELRDSQILGDQGTFQRLLSQQMFQLEAVDSDGDAAQQEQQSPDAENDSQASATEEVRATHDDESDEDEENNADSVDRQRQELTLAQLMKLRKPIGNIRIKSGSNIDPDDRPADRGSQWLHSVQPQLITASGGSWRAPSRYPVSFCHRPLYYQQPDLERCGRTCQCGSKQLGCFQNAVSGATFLANTIMLPYRIATERPDCTVPHQGDCRTCQSTGTDVEPLQRGTCGWVSEAAAVAGFTFLLL